MVARKGTNKNDTFKATSEAEDFDGVYGFDKVTYAGADDAVTINLATGRNSGDAKGDTYKNIRSFALSTFDDTFTGGRGKDFVNGGFGDDVIDGGDNNDALTGHNGKDSLFGGAGQDSLWGGGQDDYLSGGDGNDKIWGDSHADTLVGGADLGILSIEGYYTDAVVNSFAAGDILTGGSWADLFVFNAGDGVDMITDFAIGYDHIALDESLRKGFTVIDFKEGAMIVFADGAGSFAENTGIFLVGVDSGKVTDEIFV
jgi:Ca2+-binding RTX toxin-like protein